MSVLRLGGGLGLAAGFDPADLGIYAQAGEQLGLDVPFRVLRGSDGAGKQVFRHLDPDDETPLRRFELETQSRRRHLGEGLGDGAFQFTFTNTPGARFNVLATTNLALPLSEWTALGPAVEGPPGAFQFTDLTATNHPTRCYRLRWR